MKCFEVLTPKNKVKVFVEREFINKKEVAVYKELFSEMCKKGCRNYNKKYSCPPFVLPFEDLLKNFDGLLICLLWCNLNQIKSTDYNKIRIANVIMKSRIIKLMRHLEKKFNTSFLSSGSCNLCKPCKCKIGLPCAHAQQRRYSLEAAGIDCNEISKNLFGLEFQWYKNKKAPERSCIMCGLICNQEDAEKIKAEIENYDFGALKTAFSKTI
jgi:predicted metal-binding protein